eukprot:3125861-Alexandrium_andersonii.AAC.1
MLFLVQRISRLEHLKQFEHVNMYALLGSIGSIRYTLRSVLGVRVVEYLTDRGGEDEVQDWA